MFANLVQVFTGRTPAAEAVHLAFVEDVQVQERPLRNLRLERTLLVCWLLIAVKHVLILWACHHYPVPFHPLWVNLPTWMLGTLATGVYYGRLIRP